MKIHFVQVGFTLKIHFELFLGVFVLYFTHLGMIETAAFMSVPLGQINNELALVQVMACH